MQTAAAIPAIASVASGPRGLPLLGNALGFRWDSLGFMTRLGEEHGDVGRYRLGRRDVVFLRHPEHIKEVLVTQQHHFAKGIGAEWAKRFLGEGLVTSEGDFHRRQRRLAQPAFHRNRIASYGTIMVDWARRFRERWRPDAVLDVDREMMSLTLSVVAQALFGVAVEEEAQRIGASLTAILALFPRFSLPFAGALDLLPLPSNWRYNRALRHLDDTVYRMIRERRASGRDTGDLLSMLLLAQDEEEGSGGMDDRQLRDEVMTSLLAGHETTANALTWTWYLLSQNPEAEALLHAELDAVLGGRLPTTDDLPRLPYTEGVFAESMRLYPPVWGLGRRCIKEARLDGVVIPEGWLVSLSQWVTHRDGRWYPEPLRFDPGRWTPELRAARPKFSYFPFAGGARGCIGEGFAWMEGVLLIATLAQRWRMRLVPGHRVEPQPLITLRPRYGMRMVASSR
jgi:cytochrome P450